MSAQNHQVALIMPAYNEAAVVGGVVRQLAAIFKDSPYAATVVLVDDGSTDATAAEARAAGAVVISHILNSGSGAATATGLSYAYSRGFQLAATLDADGQHTAADVLSGIQHIDNSGIDLLIGSRVIDKGAMSPLKKIGNKGLSIVTMILFGITVTDSQSGLRVFSSRALAELKWRTSGYEFCSEMLWRAKQLNLNIAEFPITAVYTEYSLTKPTRQSNWNGFNIVKSLLRQRLVEIFSE